MAFVAQWIVLLIGLSFVAQTWCATRRRQAIQLAPLALIPQMLFSGLFLPVSKIPESLQWATRRSNTCSRVPIGRLQPMSDKFGFGSVPLDRTWALIDQQWARFGRIWVRHGQNWV